MTDSTEPPQQTHPGQFRGGGGGALTSSAPPHPTTTPRPKGGTQLSPCAVLPKSNANSDFPASLQKKNTFATLAQTGASGGVYCNTGCGSGSHRARGSGRKHSYLEIFAMRASPPQKKVERRNFGPLVLLRPPPLRLPFFFLPSFLPSSLCAFSSSARLPVPNARRPPPPKKIKNQKSKTQRTDARESKKKGRKKERKMLSVVKRKSWCSGQTRR